MFFRNATNIFMSEYRLRIGIGKIGRVINFTVNRQSPVGGDHEPSCLFRALANNNPDVEFYLVSRNALSRLSQHDYNTLFPYGNVIDVWSGIKKFDIRSDGYYNHVINFMKTRHVDTDFNVFIMGPKYGSSVPNTIYKKNSRGYIQPAVMNMHGSGPIVKWMNETRTPYLTIINDINCTLGYATDILDPPVASLGQYDWTYPMRTIKSYEDQSRAIYNIKTEYAATETMFCMDYDCPDAELGIRKGMGVVLTEREDEPFRYAELKRWVLNNFDDCIIYGEWKRQPEVLSDNRFRGIANRHVIQEVFSQVKYTFLLSTLTGWVTSKYVEMIHAGVLPFIHPAYDNQKHVQFPEYLRVDNPREMMTKIKELDNDDGLYKRLFHECQSLLKPEYYDGTHLSKTIMSRVHDCLGLENYVLPDIRNKQNQMESLF